MKGNFYGYISSSKGVSRLPIRIDDSGQVILDSTNDAYKGQINYQKPSIRKDGASGLILLNLFSQNGDGRLSIFLRNEDSVNQDIFLGVFTRASSSLKRIYAGRIILTRTLIGSQPGKAVDSDDATGYYELFKKEEWISISSIIVYLQAGNNPPQSFEIKKLKEEIDAQNQKFEKQINELKESQNEILKKLEKQEKHVSKSLADFKEKIRIGEIDSVFVDLLSWVKIKSVDNFNEILLLNSQWSILQKEFQLGIIQIETRILFQNRICASLIGIIEQIEHKVSKDPNL